MLTIKIPNTFFQERKYIFDIFFEAYIGIEFKYFSSKTENCEIILKNGGKIIIEDHFFKHFNLDNNTYIQKKNIPERVSYFKSEFASEKNIALIFGKPKILKTVDKIVCEFDLLSSAFFMLSRWEEQIGLKDEHDRFLAEDSFAYKNNFLDRPVVNEYIELLWNMIAYLDHRNPPEERIKRKARKFKILMTHDIDFFHKYSSTGMVRKLSGDLIKRKSFTDFKLNLNEYFKINLKNEYKDPYDKFDHFMDFSKSLNIKSIFFFMAGGNSKFDNKYKVNEKKVLETMKQILLRNHQIGLHYSYNSLYAADLFKKELKQLQKALKVSISKGRAHFLRLPIKNSFDILDESSISKDYSLGYAQIPGFKSGFCYSYYPWNFSDRNKYKNIKEYPLIVMDTTLIDHLLLSEVKLKEVIAYYYDIIKKYNGNYVILIHNTIPMENFEQIKSVFKSKMKWPR